jgi:transposase, IS30 family
VILVFGGEGFPVVRRMLTLADREEISRGLAESLEYKGIAVRIGRDASLVSREIARHGGPDRYRATVADRAAGVARSRPKSFAVDRSPGVRSVVVGLLRLGWSPASIAGRLARDREVGDPARVSHEAIYQWVYAQPVAALRRELIALRTGRSRRTGPRPVPAPRIREPRYLEDRPAEVEGRAVPGHWEGDLVIGKGGKTAVATLVERTSRFLVLVPLSGRDSLTVREAIISAVGPLPTSIKRSLTWDCGSEMALHKDITATGMPVFFAHPHSPWERGSNENLNRIVREYLPKGTEITSDPTYLAAIAAEINDRPRKIHDWRKPSEIFTELLEADASTT